MPLYLQNPTKMLAIWNSSNPAMEEAMKDATAGFGGMIPGFKMPF